MPDSFRDFNSSEESKPVKNNKMVKLELGGGVGTPPTAAVLPKDLLPARAQTADLLEAVDSMTKSNAAAGSAAANTQN